MIGRQKFRAPFDAAKVFIALRPLKIDGITVRPNERFPRDAVTMTRLRQLFDGRFVGYPDEPPKTRFLPVNPQRVRVDGLRAQPYPPSIPPNWRDLPFQARQQLAALFSKVFPRASEEVEVAIEAELARRARAV